MRVLICGGGTGGHIYPALAVIEAMRKEGLTSNDALYVGAPASAEERLAGRHGLPFAIVESGQLRGMAPWKAARSLIQVTRGIGQASAVLRRFQPEVIFSTGGYASAPVLIAGRRANVPALIYLPDVEPGMTIKLLGRLVDRVAVSFEDTRRFFPAAKVVVTGYPVRAALFECTKETARRRLNLPLGRRVLLAFGGSQGARSINRAIVANIVELTAWADVLHITGSLDFDWVRSAREALAEPAQSRYRVYEYLHDEMLSALVAADLIVARAGASTLGEFPAVGVPSILVPYPYSGQHQLANARFMERHGASVVVEDAVLAQRLVGVVGEILGDEMRYAQMVERARALARPDAARALAVELRRLAAGKAG